MDYLLFQLCNIAVIYFFADHFVKSCCFSFFTVHSLYGIVIGHCLYLIHDPFIVRRSDLGAILPVYLVAVILRRVMTGGDINTCNTSKPSDCIGQLRSRTQRFENICLDSICRKTAGRFVCKFRRHAAGIIGNGNSFFLPVIFYNIIGKPLSRLADCINIHTVCSRANHAAQSCCPEFQFPVKTFFYLVVVIPYTPKLFFRGFIKIWIPQPFLVAFAIFHFWYLLSLMYILYNRSLQMKRKYLF